ncbi:thermonuclease family protein [Paracoccus sp. FO-3]|uniref:thermonuclease family protein n=1 Tax=Paracoccus sp. FO-3 TaxID=1335059 RepID=UPI00112ECEFB|nr:thermonuclease family protein [Paracoccus sp. FO-3]
MTVLRAFLVSLLLATAVQADIAGTVSVIDGDTIEIHGQRIRLHGIDALESRQLCVRPDGRNWRCGSAGANELAAMIARRPVSCTTRDIDRYGRVVAVCHVGRQDINAWMVEQGWAVAYRQYSTDYLDEEAAARQARRGIWSSQFDMPWDWRRRNR